MSKTPLLFLSSVALAVLAGCPPAVVDLGCAWGCADGGPSSTTTSTTSDAGAGGTGGSGGAGGTGGALLCVPGAALACYGGPAATQGVGLCQAGTQACAADGMSWGPCSGEVLPQVEDCGSGKDQDCDGSMTTCVCGTTLWAERFGDGQGQEVYDLAVDADGNIVLTGEFSGVLDFGSAALTSAGSWEMFVAKLDATGKHVWSRSFGDAATPASIATDAAGNVFVCGDSSGSVDFGGGPLPSMYDGFIAELDAGGNHVWSRGFVGVHAGSMVVDPAGDVLVTTQGWSDSNFGGPLTVNGLPCTDPWCPAILVAKLDASGNHVWSQAFVGGDGFGYVQGQSIAVDASGNVIIGGVFTGSIGFGGETLTSDPFPGPPGICGGANCTGFYLAKLDAGGNHVWSRGIGLVGARMAAAFGRGIAFDTAGDVLVGGSFLGSIDLGGPTFSSMGQSSIFAAKLGANGDHVWSRAFSGDGYLGAVKLATDAARNVIMTGALPAPVDFGGGVLPSTGTYDGDMFFVKLDPNGAHRCSKRFGGAEHLVATGVAADTSGNVVMTGWFAAGSLDFGSGPLISAGGQDIFVTKLSP